MYKVDDSSEAYCHTMRLITCGWKPDGKQIKIILLLAMSVNLKQMYSCLVGWLVGFGFNGPLRQYFSLYRAVSQREGERREKG